jgi:ABC-type phosphonate transport system ATPase subunit
MSAGMLEAVNLSKRYQDTIALDSLNLTIRAGEIFCLLGAKRSWKDDHDQSVPERCYRRRQARQGAPAGRADVRARSQGRQ